MATWKWSACLILGALLSAEGAAAQTSGTRVVQAGPEYRVSGFEEFWLGKNWRDVWTAKIRVPVLDLNTFAGGLTPFREGGNQTMTLRFHGANGHTYTFRSIDKDEQKALPPDLKHTIVASLLQDQTSMFHPTGQFVVDPLTKAIGLLHTPPTLVILPDDKRLGQFRKKFAGMLGAIEERPESDDSKHNFAGALDIKGSDEAIDRLEKSLDDRVDAREYLTVRLLDFIVGDSDRGEDQWRWARFDHNGDIVWRPIPRDRDFAFMRSTGVGPSIVRLVYPKLEKYGPHFSSLSVMTLMTRDFDRSHLSVLPWSTWDDVVQGIETALTNDVIDRAIERMPPEHVKLSAAILREGLRLRRDNLLTIAQRYFEMVNREADVFGTAEAELALIERRPNGAVDVRLYRPGPAVMTDDGETPHILAWHRLFVPRETKEVRVYLQGGNDRAVVYGPAVHGITVRVTGGKGNDVLIDSTKHVRGGAHTAFYDATGDNTFIVNKYTKVSRKPYVTIQPFTHPEDHDGKPVQQAGGVQEERRGRYFPVNEGAPDALGADTKSPYQRTDGSTLGIHTVLDHKSGAGIIVGAGPRYTRYGFRRVPYQLTAQIAPTFSFGFGRFGIVSEAELHPENATHFWQLTTHAVGYEPLRFNGFGNDTPKFDANFSLVRRDEFLLRPSVVWEPSEKGWLRGGPLLKYSRLNLDSDMPASLVANSNWFGQAGAYIDGGLRLYDDELIVKKGLDLQAGGAFYPSMWDVEGAFGELHAQTVGYIPIGRPFFALRAAGQRVWGDFPVWESAFVGGFRTLRGYQWNRFAGDAALSGSLELRVPIAHTEFILHGDAGVLALTDIGRVWFDGESNDGWHNAFGGGLWFVTLNHVLTVTYAHGEEGRIYFKSGFAY